MYFCGIKKTQQFMNFSISRKISLGVLMATANFCFAQDKAEAALKKFEENYPQEKIHLLLSKNSFVAGENLWFTSFVFEGYSPSTISTSIFIELYDQNKKLISKKLYPLIKGKGSGSITLPEDLKEDVYYLRAYTTWMGNFSDDFNEIQPILVYNPSSPEKLVKDTISPWTGEVFPESGTFIDGIQTKFAVRLKSKGETPSEWEGYVTESSNPDKKIVSFKGFDQNVGSFSFIPQSGKVYQVNISDTSGKKQIISLPQVASSGINLQVKSDNDAIKFTLKSKNITADSQFKVLGTINNQLVYKAKISKISDLEYSIPTNQLINGILNLTVFDDKESIVAQRLCFVQPQILKINKPSLKNITLSTKTRDSNSFNIDQNKAIDSYTIAVMDGEAENNESEESLPSKLWLTGDLTSKIYKPSQYFTSDRNFEALDALLITEKWNRFSWQTIIAGNFPFIKYKPEMYLSYKGKAMQLGKPASEAEINLIFKMPNQGIKYNVVTTNKDGLFTLNGLIFEEDMKFSYQLNSEKATKNAVQVYFQPNFSFLPLNINLPKTQYQLVPRNKGDKISQEIERAIVNKSSTAEINEKVTLIEEVTIKAQKKDLTKKLNSELSSPLFKSNNEVVFDFVNDNMGAQASFNILQWLQGRVAGLQIQMQGGNYTASFRGSPIAFFLDEMRMDASQISTIPVPSIAMIKVIRGSFAGNFGGGDGAIAIYTKRGGTTGATIDPTLPSTLTEIKLTGYDKEVPFINNIYEDERLRNIAQDKRDVLYWNPYVESKPSESTVIQWYNNDDAKKFKVIIIGFDENNDLLYYNKVLDQSK